MNGAYDYIILGAGPAGRVLPPRLSDHGEHSALAVQARPHRC